MSIRHARTRTAILAMLMLAPALPVEADSCAQAYHAALSTIGSQRDAQMREITARLRQPIAGAPGRWLTGPQQTGRAQQDRPCLEVARSRGRERCVRFAPALSREVEAKARPTADEQRAVTALSEVVRGRGVLAEVSSGRSTAVVQRVAAEVRSYLSQPANPALCSGGRELVQFYLGQTAQISTRFEEAKRLAATLATLSGIRLRSAVAADAAELERQAEAAKPAASDQPAAPPAGATNDRPPAPRTPPAILTADTYAALTIPAMLAEVGRSVGVPAPADATASSIATTLRQVSEALRSNPLSDDVRASHWAALRLVEARHYADIQIGRYEEADTAVMGVLRDIRAAHQRHCTCGG